MVNQLAKFTAVGGDPLNYDALIAGFPWINEYAYETGETIIINFNVTGTLYPKTFKARKTNQSLRFNFIQYCQGTPPLGQAINNHATWSYSTTYNGARTTATAITLFDYVVPNANSDPQIIMRI